MFWKIINPSIYDNKLNYLSAKAWWNFSSSHLNWSFFYVAISLAPVFVSFTVSAILKTLTIFLFKILCWLSWKTATVHQRMLMVDEWDEKKYNELAPLGERLLPSHILPLVAILVEQLSEGCSEKDEKSLLFKGESKSGLHYPIV